MRRSMLFLPSNNPNMIGNGGLLGADSIIFDLEDAVSPDEKDAARELLKNALGALDFGKCERIVRINGLDTPYWEEDLRAILSLTPELIMPPKVSGDADIRRLDEKLTELETAMGIETGHTKILALLETALGVENAFAAAGASPRMMGLFWGLRILQQTCAVSAARRAPRSFMPGAGWSVPPAPPGLRPMIRPLPMCRIWRGWKRMPPLPRGWAFPERPASVPLMSPPSTGFFLPRRRRLLTPGTCSPLSTELNVWVRVSLPCEGK